MPNHSSPPAAKDSPNYEPCPGDHGLVRAVTGPITGGSSLPLLMFGSGPITEGPELPNEGPCPGVHTLPQTVLGPITAGPPPSVSNVWSGSNQTLGRAVAGPYSSVQSDWPLAEGLGPPPPHHSLSPPNPPVRNASSFSMMVFFFDRSQAWLKDEPDLIQYSSTKFLPHTKASPASPPPRGTRPCPCLAPLRAQGRRQKPPELLPHWPALPKGPGRRQEPAGCRKMGPLRATPKP